MMGALVLLLPRTLRLPCGNLFFEYPRGYSMLIGLIIKRVSSLSKHILFMLC